MKTIRLEQAPAGIQGWWMGGFRSVMGRLGIRGGCVLSGGRYNPPPDRFEPRGFSLQPAILPSGQQAGQHDITIHSIWRIRSPASTRTNHGVYHRATFNSPHSWTAGERGNYRQGVAICDFSLHCPKWQELRANEKTARQIERRVGPKQDSSGPGHFEQHLHSHPCRRRAASPYRTTRLSQDGCARH